MTLDTNPLRDCPRIGLGCWAIGGKTWAGQTPVGYANANDQDSRQAIDAAWEAGARVFDTAAAYGAGHSETLLGEVLGNRDGSIIVSKFGPVIDSAAKQITGEAFDPESIRRSAMDSRTRLCRDKIDVLLCHINSMDVVNVPPVFDTLEALRNDGIIGSYGWSTDFPERLSAAAGYPGFAAVEHGMNIFFDAPSLSAVAERHHLPQIIRSPLAMGLLTGKFAVGDKIAVEDVRSNTFDWLDYFKDGVVSQDHLERLDSLRELLTVGGRTLGQGALCWLLAKSPALIPVPGARNAVQAKENTEAMAFGPLPNSIMQEIEVLIERPEEGQARER